MTVDIMQGWVIYPYKISFPRGNYHQEFLAHIIRGTGHTRRPTVFPLFLPSTTFPFHSMGWLATEAGELQCVLLFCGVGDRVKTLQTDTPKPRVSPVLWYSVCRKGSLISPISLNYMKDDLIERGLKSSSTSSN